MPTTTIKAPKISLGIRRPADAVAKVQYGGLDLSHLYVTDKPLGLLRTCGRLLKSKRGLRTSVLVDKPQPKADRSQGTDGENEGIVRHTLPDLTPHLLPDLTPLHSSRQLKVCRIKVR